MTSNLALATGCFAKLGSLIVRVGAPAALGSLINGPHRHTSVGIVAESLLTPMPELGIQKGETCG